MGKSENIPWSAGTFARTMQLPQDCGRGVSLISVQGRTHLSVENFRGISSYTEQEIRLQTRCWILKIGGSRLQIDCYTREEIEISGRIDCISFVEERAGAGLSREDSKTDR